MKRVILMVLDGFGVGETPDANVYGDVGSNTFAGIYNNTKLNLPNLKNLGIYNIDGIDLEEKLDQTIGVYGKAKEAGDGKNSPIGHWEMAGFIKHPAFKTYPNGFPKELIDEFIKETGVEGVLCNEAGSGTEILKRFGEEHIKTKKLIVYTSADSVLQIEAHEEVFPIEKQYEICKIARRIADKPEYNIGTVIARPFIGTNSENFIRTYNRRDFESSKFGRTMLDVMKENGIEVVAIGKIEDLFSGRGITTSIRTEGNEDGIEKTIREIEKDFGGLIFTNLVDTDMLYGHRNDIKGYAKALEYFDSKLTEIMSKMKKEDLLIITGDHGNDPSTPSTDHSREYIPILVYGKNIKQNVNLGVRETFADISATVLDHLELPGVGTGKSFYNEITKKERIKIRPFLFLTVFCF